jgi:hypothetical protein
LAGTYLSGSFQRNLYNPRRHLTRIVGIYLFGGYAKKAKVTGIVLWLPGAGVPDNP